MYQFFEPYIIVYTVILVLFTFYRMYKKYILNYNNDSVKSNDLAELPKTCGAQYVRLTK